MGRVVCSTLLFVFSLGGASPTEAQVSQLRVDSTRIRLGVDGGLGPAFLNGDFETQVFGALAATGRLGVQFNSTFGLYYQMGGWALGREGVPVDAPVGSVGDSEYYTVGVWSHTANVDFTFGDVFQLGFGAGMSLVGEGFNAFPGFDARLAFLLGTSGPGSRGAFQVGLKSHFVVDLSTRSPALLSVPVVFAGFELY